MTASGEAPDRGTPHDHVTASHRFPSNKQKGKKKLFLEDLGESIRAYRGETPPKAFAKEIGITTETLRQVEKAETQPSFDTLWRLAIGVPIIIVRSKVYTRNHRAR